MLHQLQEKAGRISDLSVTLDSVRADLTTLTQQLTQLPIILLYIVQGQEKSDTVLHQLQEKAGRTSDLSVTLDSVRAEVTTLTQQLENETQLPIILLCIVQGQEKSDTVLHQLQEKAGRTSDLSVTLDSVRAEVTTLTQQLENESQLPIILLYIVQGQEKMIQCYTSYKRRQVELVTLVLH